MQKYIVRESHDGQLARIYGPFDSDGLAWNYADAAMQRRIPGVRFPITFTVMMLHAPVESILETAIAWESGK